ncbi:MAG: 16S rRNA (guanine(527)-N(7))-methyltransferase RsmG [Alteromonas sp.]|nr:16S rRNA (guanine(527)-N(7))-methyltransferase RsmG [Alteromonas sp.]MAY23389.1 16S rRNA (guanine(527)-N(7))-methyltransferase RsmG [Flavobacteriaceae bacterium]|tara:strand:+ start:30187 stop:30816 length:630 start_codon:yes stop_codon:yes gene_type:complete
MDRIQHYFPEISEAQRSQFSALFNLYVEWNQKINVISRKDIDELYKKHVLHSLGIAKVQPFLPSSTILDVGTGGGFPGIPLAILFPETRFHLVDSIGKKIKVVDEVAAALQLENVTASHARVETIEDRYDFIVSRAVTQMPTFVGWVKDKVAKKSKHELKNGILYLKGGDLTEELHLFPKAKVFPLATYFSEDFFETKSVVHLPLKYKP